MALDRAEICKRLSPNTLFNQWMRSHYTHASWRIRALMISGIFVSLSLHQNGLYAICMYAFALGLMRAYFIQPNKGGFFIFELHRFGLQRIRNLNAEVIQAIAQNETSKSFCDRGVFALIELEKLRCLADSLEGGPFKVKLPSNDNDPSKQLETLLTVNDTFSKMRTEFQWLKELESKLNQMSERYVLTLRGILLLPQKTGMTELTKVVNDYATIALGAIEHPYSPLQQVA